MWKQLSVISDSYIELSHRIRKTSFIVINVIISCNGHPVRMTDDSRGMLVELSLYTKR